MMHNGIHYFRRNPLMHINTTTTITTLSVTTATTTPTPETSFEDVMHAVAPSTGKHGRAPLPMLQKLISIIEEAAAQGHITATERDEYLAILEEIQQKLAEIKNPQDPLCKHEACMQMKPLFADGMSSLDDPLFPTMPTQGVQTAASFFFQSNVVSFEKEALAEFKTWVEDISQDEQLPPKAKEALDAFVALRERFVAMLTALQKAIAAQAPANTLSESEAAARFMSGMVQKPVPPTPPTADSSEDAEPEVEAVSL